MGWIYRESEATDGRGESRAKLHFRAHQWIESHLPKMEIVRKSVGDAASAHDLARSAIREAPFLIAMLRINLEGFSEEIAGLGDNFRVLAFF